MILVNLVEEFRLGRVYSNWVDEQHEELEEFKLHVELAELLKPVEFVELEQLVLNL